MASITGDLELEASMFPPLPVSLCDTHGWAEGSELHSGRICIGSELLQFGFVL